MSNLSNLLSGKDMITSLKVRESLKIEKYLADQVVLQSYQGKESALDAFARSLDAFKDFVDMGLRKQNEKHELERKIWERDHSELRRAQSSEIALMQMCESQCEKLEKQRDLANERSSEMSKQIESLKQELATARHEKNVAESELRHVVNEQNTNAYVFPSYGDEEDSDDDEDASSSATMMSFSFPDKTPCRRRTEDSDSSSVDSERIYLRRRSNCSTDSERDLGETGRRLISSQNSSHLVEGGGLSVFSIATATTPGKRRR